MLEDSDGSTRHSGSENERGVVEFIADNKIALKIGKGQHLMTILAAPPTAAPIAIESAAVFWVKMANILISSDDEGRQICEERMITG